MTESGLTPSAPIGCGRIYLVGTPIGNLEDLTDRSRRILAEVALIAAEDTRRTKSLLRHLDIHTPLESLHAHNEQSKAEGIIERVLGGKDIALVSDAGLPGISDPGYILVRDAVALGVPIEPIPGPTAFAMALVASGLPTDRFLFLGFPPPKQGKRRRLLEDVNLEPGSIIFYEGLSRVVALLVDIHEVLPGRKVVVARELTKLNEEFLRGEPLAIAEALSAKFPNGLKGEYTVIVQGGGRQARRERFEPPRPKARGLKDIAQEASEVMGIPRRKIYQALLDLREEHEAEGEGLD